jgi:DNA-binding GntR family transcriptional regulator
MTSAVSGVRQRHARSTASPPRKRPAPGVRPEPVALDERRVLGLAHEDVAERSAPSTPKRLARVSTLWHPEVCDRKLQMAYSVSDTDHGLHLLQPLEARESVEQRVVATLRRLIVGGSLPEGTPLVQRELAQRLGVSQTPVRTALLHLAREGLVSTGATGRATVSWLTREGLEEVYAARLGLEGLAARLGAEAVTQPHLSQMRRLLVRLRELASAEDVDAYLRARWDFHATCYAAAGRPRLLAEVERLYWRSERYNRLVLSGKERYRRSIGNYQRFFAAVHAHDGDKAERVIHESVRWTVRMLGPGLRSERDAAPDRARQPSSPRIESVVSPAAMRSS